MSALPDTISSPIDLSLVVADGTHKPVHADLSYCPHDPYAVQCAFHTGGADTVEWTFARSLLTDGVTRPVGDGDVQVWPATGTGEAMVCISLSSPSGRAMFEARLTQIVEFLAVTYQFVPTGCESDFVDIDAALDSLLADES